MEIAEHIDAVRRQGESLAGAAERAGLDATVPHRRLERTGAESVAAELSRWYTPTMTVESAVRVDVDTLRLRAG